MNATDSMDADLAALEQRVTAMVDVVRRLRAEKAALVDENATLRDQKSRAERESAALRVKVDSATERLQRLLERLPEEAA